MSLAYIKKIKKKNTNYILKYVTCIYTWVLYEELKLQIAWRCIEWKRAMYMRAWHVPISCSAYEQLHLIVTFTIYTNFN